MEHIKNLTTLPPDVSVPPTASTESELNDRHISLLWERMAMIYGHRWTSSFGEKDDGTWQLGLHDVTVDQIKTGLENCRTSGEAWPPSLPEFRAMCLPPRKEKMHQPLLPDRSKPWTSPDPVLRFLSECRKLWNRDENNHPSE